MPLVQISIAEGRSQDDLRSLMGEVHEAVVRAIGAPEASVRVLVTEVPPTQWLSGGQTLAEKAAAAKA
ncbi:tautomerase family protein [Agrococcus carbonis]|uniref:4-oxalocrotonate tautomerase n=1 Tax=Agrococcus carbonis TaxID=684552 RepID=A0A1H1NG03_9MICO|nr:tautomerase family protein [Agrococcus carbonis]SDR97695.1 4-oxalocrotonate tautomerase [Agrococcus carbonis]